MRLRRLSRIDLPVSSKSLKLVGWNETFYVLNDTGWAKGHRFDVVLNFIGIGVPLTKKGIFEPGYISFRVFRPGGPDQINHAIGLFISGNL